MRLAALSLLVLLFPGTVLQAQSRQELQAHAKAAFDREMAREKAGDCPDARTTMAMNQCYGGAIESSEVNYRTYVADLRAMLAQGPDSSTNGPTGRSLTRQEFLTRFDQEEAAWQKYREAMLSGADGLYRGGTIVNVMSATCNLMLLRSHMRELVAVYGEYFSH